ncbi:MAG: Nramp family divalent metal transporter [Bdellovibrio sp.]|nr:Nramp family divalent metal transporter [Bdellovibrio sp.]
METRLQETRFKRSIKKALILLSIIGPGLITANIDNDAGGIATYSIAGAHTGYRLLWLLIPITIALICIQEMGSRMAIVTGKGLADLIREKYGLRITFYTLSLCLIADLGNITAEFAGLASASEIFGLSRYIAVPICALLVWPLVIKGNYKIVERVFILGCFVYISYIITGFIIGPDWNSIGKSLISPNFGEISKLDMPIIVGLVGTSITPWMQFYIQSAVVEKGTSVKDLNYARLDVIIGCITMSIVTLFIIICCAETLFTNKIEISGAKDAALALEPLAGKYSSFLFAIGLFNASIFAAALLPLAASYYVCEGMGWESGVDKSFKEAPNFFTIFTFLIIIAAGVTLIPHISLFKILIWSQVINGILIPVILLYITNLCSDPDVMGDHTNGPIFNFLCYTITAAMFLANFALLYYEFK